MLECEWWERDEENWRGEWIQMSEILFVSVMDLIGIKSDTFYLVYIFISDLSSLVIFRLINHIES